MNGEANGEISVDENYESYQNAREIPKLFDHCLKLYNLMDASAIGEEGDKIYTGSIGPLVVSIGLAASYQSKLTDRLKKMSCVANLKRGSGAAKSVWGLYKKPTINDFFASDETGDVKIIKAREKYDAQTQRIKDLTGRVIALEDWCRKQGMSV